MSISVARETSAPRRATGRARETKRAAAASTAPGLLNGRVQTRLKGWLTCDGEFFVGPRYIRLLEAVDVAGTIRGACDSCDMSYRTCINRIRQMERTLGVHCRIVRLASALAILLASTAAAQGVTDAAIEGTTRVTDSAVPDFVIALICPPVKLPCRTSKGALLRLRASDAAHGRTAYDVTLPGREVVNTEASDTRQVAVAGALAMSRVTVRRLRGEERTHSREAP